MIEKSLWVATLKPDMAERYERLHANQPEEIAAQLADKGFVHLDIYRSGMTLYMTWEVDPDLAIPNRMTREEAEREWDRLTGECFAEPWRQVPVIFKQSEHAFKARSLNAQGEDANGD
ncbi:L-rhamnose mutarotase [Cohnella suwonensis]|uniref:L-rhamnose mutarotase n=1 Tax=Cohnella suwonensis TaxID=696072 RepID=A0ABW0M0T9_9BACL